jgi:PAS domain-containing protein
LLRRALKMRRDEPTIKVLLAYADSIIDTLREPFLVLDKNLQVISANRVFYTTFEVTKKDTIVVGWNKSLLHRDGSNIVETFGGCASLHPLYDLITRRK